MAGKSDTKTLNSKSTQQPRKKSLSSEAKSGSCKVVSFATNDEEPTESSRHISTAMKSSKQKGRDKSKTDRDRNDSLDEETVDSRSANDESFKKCY